MKKTTLYDSNHSPSKIRGGQGALITIICTIMILLSACTRNHGDIGIWFGTWHVEQITANGTPVNVEGDYFFQFQSKVFRVSQVYGHEQMVDSYGTWDENGDKMTISFPDQDVAYNLLLDQLAQGSTDNTFHFVVNRQSDQRVQLVCTNVWGDELTLHLHKQ